jgi:IS30 family transposase
MSHLTLKQRYRIEFCISENKTLAEIAEYIDKDKSVISREIKRNSDARNSKYKAELADAKAKKRHLEKPKKNYFTDQIKVYVVNHLEQGYSPEQIAGRSKLDGIACVSHETIYKFIWNNKKSGGSLFKHLRNQGKRYRKRGQTKDSRGLLIDRVDIDQRPEVVDLKERIGDLEIDLIIGKGHNQALLTINDRATGLLFMGKVPNKEAREIELKTISLLENWRPLIHTITSDNGKEFANHRSIAKQLNLNFYFAKPYHSWQRGANENLNGLVRQYFPKDYHFSSISDDDILNVQNILNNRPRKRLGYKSPIEVFAQKLDQLASVAFIS